MRKRAPRPQPKPQRRAGTLRISAEVARRLRDGHPWVFEDALQGRHLNASQQEVEIVDQAGHFVARALHDPAGPAVLRVFSRVPGRRFDGDFLVEAVGAAARSRRRLLDLAPDGCFRALSGDCEAIPAVSVDYYAGFLVVIGYSAVVERYLDPLVSALTAVWRPKGVYLQRRYRAAPAGKGRPGAELIAGSAAGSEVIVTEDGLRYAVDVTAPLGTGLFADMRLGRRAVARLAAGRRVLNCFSYTGAFSLVAAAHGASAVTSVDSANRAHGRARRNFGENQIDGESTAHRFITGDAVATMARMAERDDRHDLVIIDPPTFSTGKGRPFTALKDYSVLIAAALRVLDSGGLICAASNAAKLPTVDFDRAVARGAADAKRQLAIVERVGQPPDYPVKVGFPESGYLKFVVAAAD